MPFFYVDWYYIVLVLPAVILSLWASAHVKSTFRRYSQVRNARGMTGAEAAMAVLRAHGVTDVRVEHVSGDLTDHFDPKDHVIRLSDSVYNVATPAAVGVAAHEAGHAVQYARHYAPIYIRAAIVPVTNIGSRLSMPLIVLGLALSGLGQVFYYVALAGGCRLKLHCGPGMVKRGNVEDKEVRFILDNDVFMNGKIELKHSAGALNTVHTHADRIFRGAITDQLHNAMEPQPL